MNKHKFLFSYNNLDFWQVEKDLIQWDYNDGKYHDSFDQENISSAVRYLTNEGFFNDIGKIHDDAEFGKIQTFSIIRRDSKINKSAQ